MSAWAMRPQSPIGLGPGVIHQGTIIAYHTFPKHDLVSFS